MIKFKEEKLQEIQERRGGIKKHTIMVVDDEKDQLKTIKDLLSKDYHIITTGNGQEALDIILKMENRDSIAIIISDQRMPGLTGIQFFEELKNKNIIPNALLFILTAFDDKSIIIDSINKIRVYQFILKPVEPEDLKLRIKRAIEAYDQKCELDKYQQNREKMMKAQTVALQEFFTEKQQLLSMIAHDLSNYMMAIAAPAEALQAQFEKLTGDKRREYINRLYDAQKNLSELLIDFVDCLLGKKDKDLFKIEKVDICALINKGIDSLAAIIMDKKITVYSDIIPDTFAYASKTMSDAIIRNLLNNAVKFSPLSGWIKINAVSKEEFVEVSIINNGEGISNEDMSMIFEIYSAKSKKGTANESGCGMGLALCKDLVEKNNGQIQVISEPGNETRVTFTLPIYKLPNVALGHSLF